MFAVSHSFHGTIRSIWARNSFFFVRTCANSSLSADFIICLSMVLLYHFWQYRAYFSVRYCLRFFYRSPVSDNLSSRGPTVS